MRLCKEIFYVAVIALVLITPVGRVQAKNAESVARSEVYVFVKGKLLESKTTEDPFSAGLLKRIEPISLSVV